MTCRQWDRGFIFWSQPLILVKEISPPIQAPGLCLLPWRDWSRSNGGHVSGSLRDSSGIG